MSDVSKALRKLGETLFGNLVQATGLFSPAVADALEITFALISLGLIIWAIATVIWKVVRSVWARLRRDRTGP